VEKEIRTLMRIKTQTEGKKFTEVKMDNNNGIFSGEAKTPKQYGQPGQPQPTEQPFPVIQPAQDNYVQPGQPQKPEKKPGIMGKLFGGILLSLVIMGLFIGVQFVVAIVLMFGTAIQYALESPGDVNYTTQMLMQTMQGEDFLTNLTVIATAVSAVIAVFFYWLLWGRKRTAEDKRYFHEKVLKGKNFLMISIATVGLYFLAILISNIIGIVSPDTMEEYNEMMNMALGGNIFMVLLATIILAPISEECIMRGMIFQNLRKYFSVPAAIVIQAVIFGIFHMNWVQGLYVLPVGLALGFVAAKSRSVLPCIFMHMLNNFMSVVLAILPEFCQKSWFCIVAAAVCAAAVWLMYRQDKELSSDAF